MYYVERNSGDLGWRKVPFIEHRTLAYCEGYVVAFDSLYPSDPLRIIKIDKNGVTKIVKTTLGHSKVHLN